MADIMVGAMVSTSSVMVPNFMIRAYDTKNGRLFTFIMSTPSVTLLCSASICGGSGMMVSAPSKTGVDFSHVVFPFKFATLGPHISTAFLTHSLVMGEFSNDLLSIIHNIVFVVRPAVSCIFCTILVLLIYLWLNFARLFLTVFTASGSWSFDTSAVSSRLL